MTIRKIDKSLYTMRKEPLQARSQATVDAIMEAAAQLLLDIGYDEASTNKIAERAGVSIGSVYEYFPGKEAVYAELRRQEDRKQFDLAMGLDEPQSIRELIINHQASYIEFIKSNLTLHAALLNEVPQFAAVHKDLYLHKNYIPSTVAFFQAHKDEIRPFKDLAKIVEFIMFTGRATIDNYVLNSPEMLHDSSLQELLEDLWKQFLFDRR